MASSTCSTGTAPWSRRGGRAQCTCVGAGGFRSSGPDVGGTKTNATVLGVDGRFLVDRMVEVNSRVLDGPAVAVRAIEDALDRVLAATAQRDRGSVLAVGLDTPGPASAEGVISVRGATNFSGFEWRGFDFRGAVAKPG